MSRHLSNWFSRLFSLARANRSRPGLVRRSQQRFRLEQLEGREVPTTLRSGSPPDPWVWLGVGRVANPSYRPQACKDSQACRSVR
jgi:hypothetical protein